MLTHDLLLTSAVNLRIHESGKVGKADGEFALTLFENRPNSLLHGKTFQHVC